VFDIDICVIYAVIVAALYKSAVVAAVKQNKLNAATYKQNNNIVAFWPDATLWSYNIFILSGTSF